MSFVKKITDDIFLFWKNYDRITRLKPTGPEAINGSAWPQSLKMRRKKKIEKENSRKEEETMSEKNVAFTRDRSIPKSYELVLTALFTAIIVVMAFTPLGFIPLVVINATIIHIPVILGAIFCGPKKGAFLGFVFGLTSFIKNTLMPTSMSAFVFSPILASSIDGAAGVVKSTIICFVPRILVGIIPYFVYRGIVKLTTSSHAKAAKVISNLVISALLLVGIHAFFAKMLTTDSKEMIGWISGAAAAVIYFIVVELTGRKKDGRFLGYVYAGVTGALTNTLLVMPMIYIFYKEAYANALSIEPGAVMGVILGVISFNGIIEVIVAAVLVAAIGMVLNKVHRR